VLKELGQKGINYQLMHPAFRTFCLLLSLWSICAWSAVTYRLYLKDGGHHRVSDHRVEGERVKFFSAERGDWEEVPLELVDLKKTDNERSDRAKREAAAAKADVEEKKFDKQERIEIGLIPQDDGLFRIENGHVVVYETSELKTKKDKARGLAKIALPIPIVQGKARVELPGITSKQVIKAEQPEFFLRATTPMPMALVRLKVLKETRLVDEWKIEPMTGMITERKLDKVDLFERNLDDALTKFWPLKALPPGEYAIVAYNELEPDIRVWDFTIK
jgi:hypothetical protein